MDGLDSEFGIMDGELEPLFSVCIIISIIIFFNFCYGMIEINLTEVDYNAISGTSVGGLRVGS